MTWPTNYYGTFWRHGMPMLFPEHLLEKEPPMRKPDIQWEVKTTEKEFSVERVVKEMLEAGADVFEVRSPGGGKATFVRCAVWQQHARNCVQARESFVSFGTPYAVVRLEPATIDGESDFAKQVLAYLERRKRELSLIKTTQVGWRLT